MKDFRKKGLLVIFMLTLLMVSIGLTGCGNDKKSTETKINEDTSKNNNEVEASQSDEEALAIGRELYKRATNYYFGSVKYNTSEIIDGMYYKINNADEIKADFTQRGFEQYINTNDFVKEVNGTLYRIAADRGGDIFYIGNELEVVSVLEDEIIFNSYEKFIIDEKDLGRDESEIEHVDRRLNKFIVKKENGKWKIHEYKLAS